MRVQIITFRLRGLSNAEYRNLGEALAPSVAALPGLLSKVWLEDAETNTCGGVLIWRDRAAMEAGMSSELMQGVANYPNFADFEVRDYLLLETHSRVTHGLPGLVKQ